jgi:hypothetical protein
MPHRPERASPDAIINFDAVGVQSLGENTNWASRAAVSRTPCPPGDTVAARLAAGRQAPGGPRWTPLSRHAGGYG